MFPSICQWMLLMMWSNTYADMCLRCPCCSREKHLWASGGKQRWTAFPSHRWLCLCFPDGVPAELRDGHDNVGFVNISLAWWRRRRGKMEGSAAWPRPATLTLSLITVAPSKQERQTRTVCSERQAGHPVNPQRRPEGPVRSLPFDFRPCCKFNIFTIWGWLISTTVSPVSKRTTTGVGKRAWEQAAGCLPSAAASVLWELLWKLALPQSFTGESGLVEMWLEEKLAFKRNKGMSRRRPLRYSNGKFLNLVRLPGWDVYWMWGWILTRTH